MMKQVENAQVMQNEALSLAVRSFMEAGGSSPILSGSYLICPGFCDVHVHFREPGYFYKETVHTGCDAAIGGGYTAVCTMPNLNPVPDCVESLNLQLNAIKEDGRIAVLPYGAITVGRSSACWREP
jgi:dihydroorotase